MLSSDVVFCPAFGGGYDLEGWSAAWAVGWIKAESAVDEEVDRRKRHSMTRTTTIAASRLVLGEIVMTEVDREIELVLVFPIRLEMCKNYFL